ncbi:transmembrane protein [Legionella sainthelensi]|uniref:Probable membrane transporter protein n=1 Tax=Legionella sainthelensi TaxID=28087 RepID=A0A0W0YG59_9GAMM|nr:sulfite exporter TauE/SafE family protein [Legionella sainthelensi]KTD55945.1 transmembrane protein [Legionella sainthelensi]VEH29109.1 transmembrane protein [Legionella sainthelensi]
MIGVYLFAGIITGLLATLFGFGGGFVVVPLLFWLLPFDGIPKELAMHMAVGTSLMLMFINMIYAAWLHYLKQNMDIILLRKMLPLVAVGAVSGALIATILSAKALKYAFLMLIFLVLLRNLKQEFFKNNVSAHKKPTNAILYFVSYFTGTIAALLGIGGSVIIVPFFRHYGVPMNKASALANGLAAPSGLIGSIIFIAAGIHIPHLPPYSTGYLYWPALITIFLASIMGAKLGIHFSNLIPDKVYGKIYCFLLLIVIVCMMLN